MMNAYSQVHDTLQVKPVSSECLRRILLVGGSCLLEEGLARLLTARPDLEVYHAVHECLDDLTLRATRLQPDIIILCHLDAAMQDNLVARLDGIRGLADLRIIVVHLQNTELTVYHHKQWYSAVHTAFFPLVYGESAGLGRVS